MQSHTAGAHSFRCGHYAHVQSALVAFLKQRALRLAWGPPGRLAVIEPDCCFTAFYAGWHFITDKLPTPGLWVLRDKRAIMALILWKQQGGHENHLRPQNFPTHLYT